MRAPTRDLPLVLDDVSLDAGATRLIDRASLTIAPGAPTLIVGPNGAGKTSLLRLCMGLAAPSSGRITWGGRIDRAPTRRAIVFQRPVMLRRSAAANLGFALGQAGVPRRDRARRIASLLDRVGLADLAQRPARRLSGGEQQRLALARVWALRPEVVFLDEPTANLDPTATWEIERVIDAMHDAGTKIVMVTHNLGQARRIGDEILFLHQGRLVERTPADRFFTRPASTDARRFLEGELPW